jgi:hypothetical protein
MINFCELDITNLPLPLPSPIWQMMLSFIFHLSFLGMLSTMWKVPKVSASKVAMVIPV